VLGELDVDALPARLVGTDCFVVGTPMYRATYTGLLKSLLDRTPRGLYEPGEPPFRARPVAVVGTGASAHHFLGVDPLIALLVRFFGAFVVPPAFYADHAAFDETGALGEAAAVHARQLGAATAALAQAIASSPTLQATGPQV
jgi:FMN reductase